MSNISEFRRPFSLEDLTKEEKENYDRIIKNVPKFGEGNRQQIAEALENSMKYISKKEAEHRDRFPPNPPHSKCKHALLSGLSFSKFNVAEDNSYTYYCSFGLEKLYIWNHAENKYLSLISEVEEEAKIQNVWKTFGSCLQLTIALSSYFESMDTIEYNWIYYFDESLSIDNQKFLEPEYPMFHIGGIIEQLTYIPNHAPLLELLLRDDRYYTAAQNLYVSLNNHHFCIVCALGMEGSQKHGNHEPANWVRTGWIPVLETAIVQATRCVEALLGKPGRSDNQRSIARLRERWNEKININPDAEFPLSETSFLEYYYELFELRNSAAHSLGELSYEMRRNLAIKAQSFAWETLFSYFKNNKIKFEKALSKFEIGDQYLEML